MAYRLHTAHSLDALVPALDAWRDGSEPGGESLASWFSPDSLLLVQSRHLRDWLHLDLAHRRGIVFHRDVLLADEAIRLVLATFLAAVRDLDPALAVLADTTAIFPDSLSLLILGALERDGQGGAVADWFRDPLRKPEDRYLLARDLADSFHDYTLNHGEASDRPHWQLELYHRVFPAGSPILPLGAVLARTLALLASPDLAARVGASLVGRGLPRDGAGPLQRLGIFGSAFLPRKSLDFLARLASLGVVEVDHFLHLPFRTLPPGAVVNPALPAQVDAWAGLGDSLVADLVNFGVEEARNLPPPGSPREPAWAEGLIRIIACPSRRREVEVVKDLILDALARDPSLRVNRIAILCPQPEDYRDHVAAVFPAWDTVSGHGPDALPWHFLDTPGTLTDFEHALGLLLDLPGTALERSVVGKLLDSASFRAAVGLESGDVATLRDWITESGGHAWMDAGHRASGGLPASLDGTWDSVLTRLGLGVVYGSDRGTGARAPLEPGASGLRLLGVLDHLLESLGRLARGQHWAGTRPVEDWATALRADFLGGWTPGRDDDDAGDEAPVGRLLVAPEDDPGPKRLSAALSALVQRVMDLGEDYGRAMDFSLFRALLREELANQGGGSGQALLQGVVIARFQPFRVLPFDHIICMGMGEGSFPSPEESRSIHLFGPGGTGATNRRPQDLYSFLETLCTWRKSLHIVYQGRNPESRQIMLPAAPVAGLVAAAPGRVELMEAGLHAFETALTAKDRKAPWTVWTPPSVLAGRTRRIAGALGAAPGGHAAQSSWSLEGSSAEVPARQSGQSVARPGFPPLAGDLDLGTRELRDLFRNPLAAWARTRLQIVLRDEEDVMEDADMASSPTFFDDRAIRRSLLPLAFGPDPEAPAVAARAHASALARSGRVAGGHFLDRATATWEESALSLGKFHDGVAGYGVVTMPWREGRGDRIPSHKPLALTASFRIWGPLEPWLAIGTPGESTVALIRETRGKPDGADAIRALGDVLPLVGLVLEGGRDVIQGQNPVSIGVVWLDSTKGESLLCTAALAAWRAWLPRIEDAVRRILGGPVPAYWDFLRDKDSVAALRAAGAPDTNPREREEARIEVRGLLEDWYTDQGIPDTSGFSFGSPGNCPWYRLVYQGAKPWAGQPWDSPDLVEVLACMNEGAALVLPKEGAK